MRIDPSEHTVDELKAQIEDVEDVEDLWAALEAEKSGKDRKTAKKAIERRIDAVEDAGTADDADREAADGDGGGSVDAPLDPGEFEIAELGPAIQDVEELDGLEAILAAEKAGQDRVPVTQLVESRIEKFEDDSGDDGGLDLAEATPADVANAVRDIDEVDELEDLLERERDAGNRDSVVTRIENRLESVQGSDEDDGDGIDHRPPEEKYPELDHPTFDKQHVRALEDGEYRDMWVYCETQQGELIDVATEMLGKARELMDEYNETYDESERVVGVLIGDDVETHVEEVAAYGADVVVYHEDDRLARFQHEPYTEIFCDMGRAADHPHGRETEPADWRDYDEPRYTVFPATNNGRDLSALVQAEFDSGLASDCSDLYIEEAMISNPAKTGEPGTNKEFDRVLHMKRPDFSGFEYSTILCLDKPNREFHPQGASVIPGSFPLPEPDYDREAEVIEHDMPLEESWFGVEVTDYDQLSGGVDLTGHDTIVALGRGIGENPTEGIELGLDLVDALEDCDLGLSRGVITASYDFEGHVEGYVTEERQIGESGQAVEPDVYIAAGISGAVQHKVGMDESDTVIAINTDPDADIKDFSDYYVRGDLFEVLPRLTEALETGELSVEAMADGGTEVTDPGANAGEPTTEHADVEDDR
jgi:electron transfer flavoprotein alpha subunit